MTGGAHADAAPLTSRSTLDGPRWLRVVLMVVVGWLVILPIGGITVGMFWSVSPGDPGGHLTLRYLIENWTSPEYLEALWHTILLAVCVSLIATPIGISVSWLVTKTDLPCKGLFRRLMIIPIFISPLVATLAWIALASSTTGFLNVGWSLLIGQQGKTFFNVFSFAGMLLVMATHYASYAFVYGCGAFQAIDPSMEEASSIAGAGTWTVLRTVVLPLTKPSILASALMIFVLAAEQFAVPSLLGKSSGFSTLPSLIFYKLEYSPIDPHGATIAGSMLLVVTIVGLLFLRYAVRNSRRYVTVGGKGARPSKLIALSKTARTISVSLLSLYFFVIVVLPLAAITFGSTLRFLTSNTRRMVFTAENYNVFFNDRFLMALKNTLFLAVVTSLGVALLGTLIAYVITRRWKGGHTLDLMSSLPTALPGLVLAIGLLWVYSLLPLGLYGTIWILVVAYLARFLAHGVRLSTTGMMRLSPDLDEAARIAGASPLRRLMNIQVPLIRFNIVSILLLVMVYAVVEVSSTIVIYAPETMTVSIFMWSGMQMSGSVQVFAVATAQCLVIGTIVLAAFRWIEPKSIGA